MRWLNQRNSVVLAEPLSQSIEQLYATNLDELHAASNALTTAGLAVAAHRDRRKDLRMSIVDGQTVVQVNAMGADPELTRLESHRARCLDRHNQLLNQHAALKTALGLCR